MTWTHADSARIGTTRGTSNNQDPNTGIDAKGLVVHLWGIRVLLVAAVWATFGLLGGTHGEAATAPLPRVTALVHSPTGLRLRQLDARTLAPVPGGWSRAVGAGDAVAVSPLGGLVAVTGRGDRVLVLRADTGRVVGTRFNEGSSPRALWWLGADRIDGLLVFAGDEGCWALGCGPEFGVVGEGSTLGFAGWASAALREGLVLQSGYDHYDPTSLSLVVSGGFGGVELPRMSAAAPSSTVADVARSRVFVISSGGLVAEVDRINEPNRSPRVRYHPVALSGRPFGAVWAGAGRIALFGEDGLGTIDTRTWTTHSIAPIRVKGMIATPFGIVVWTDDPADGLTVYRPNGSKRLRLLVGKQVKEARAVRDYLYADTNDKIRYSINLRTGTLTRTLRPSAKILVPDIVAIP